MFPSAPVKERRRAKGADNLLRKRMKPCRSARPDSPSAGISVACARARYIDWTVGFWVGVAVGKLVGRGVFVAVAALVALAVLLASAGEVMVA